MFGSAQSQHEPYSYEDQKKVWSMGKEGSHPYTTLNGDCPYALYTVAFNANSTYANTYHPNHPMKELQHTAESAQPDLWNLSDCPSVYGWYEEDKPTLVPNLAIKIVQNSDTNLGSWSLNNLLWHSKLAHHMVKEQLCNIHCSGASYTWNKSNQLWKLNPLQ